MLHSPFAHNERRKANKAVNGQTKTRSSRVLVVTTIEISGLSARLQFVLSQRPQPHNSDAFFLHSPRTAGGRKGSASLHQVNVKI
jgi:hypothetical protein